MASSGRGAGGKAAKDVHKSYRLRAGRRLFSGEVVGFSMAIHFHGKMMVRTLKPRDFEDPNDV